MAEPKPQPPGWARASIAPLIFAVMIAAIVGAALLWNLSKTPAPGPTSVPAMEPTAKPAPKATSPVLGRADFIVAADAAASAYAAGDKQEGGEGLIGRDFEIRLPFGCLGPDPTNAAQASYQYDAPSHAVKITAHVSDWTDLPLIQEQRSSSKIEGAEGFWIPRPWARSEDCPVARDIAVPATPTSPAAQTVGLAELFSREDSRLPRRAGRPYEFVRRVPENDLSIASHAYRLGLAGRVVGYEDGRAAHCWAETLDHRPICLFAVVIRDRWFEDAVTGEHVADWRD